MRAKEFIAEDGSCGAVVSGSIAPVAMPVGEVTSRQGIVNRTKYANTPFSVKKRKNKNARG